MAAVLERRRRTCPECGLAEEDWGWHDAEGKVHRYIPPPFDAVPVICYPCRDKAEARDDIPDEETKGTFVVLRRVPGWRPERDEDDESGAAALVALVPADDGERDDG